MAESDSQNNQELTADELDAQDVSLLPNREAMSLVSTGATPLPVTGDVHTLPVQADDGLSTTDPPEYLGPPVKQDLTMDSTPT